MPELPTDWVTFHGDNLATLDAAKIDHAVRYLNDMLSTQTKQLVRKMAARDPQGWWTAHHFHWGMGVRNLLRKGGFGEEYFGIANLDDYYIGLVEMAVGVRGGTVALAGEKSQLFLGRHQAVVVGPAARWRITRFFLSCWLWLVRRRNSRWFELWK